MQARESLKVRLQFEALEARRLLAGLNVSVFLDQNATQAFEPEADQVGAGRILFLDQDRSSDYTEGEPIAITGVDGVADFGDLDAGDYWVGLMPHAAQRQVTSTGVSSSTSQIGEQTGQFLLPTANHDRVWLIDNAGRFGEVGSSSPTGMLGGQPIFSESLGDDSWLVVLGDDSGDYQFLTFDAATGANSRVNWSGLPYGASLTDVAVGRETIAVAYVGTEGSAVAFASRGEQLEFGESVAIDVNAIVAHPQRAEFYSSSDDDQAIVQWDSETSTIAATTQVDGSVVGLELGGNGLLAVSLSSSFEGPQSVVVLGPDGSKDEIDSLSVRSILADAGGPMAFSPSGNKLLTGGTEAGLTVWDSSTWQLLGRSGQAQGISATQIHVDDHSENALLLDSSGVFATDLAVALPQFVQLRDDDLEVLSLGVRLDGDNDAPTGAVPDRALSEDTVDIGNLAEFDFVDQDNDRLFFSVLSQPASGHLVVSPGGSWEYVPGQDFAGSDTAEILVHDGVASSAVTVQIDVQPVNDPPVSLTAEVSSVREGAIDGEIGLISIVDVDRDAAYEVSTSDERFTVRNGRLFAAGAFDHELESQVVFDIYAVDATDPSIMITTPATLTIVDVNEPPTSLTVEQTNVQENIDGGVVGRVVLDDPDSSQEYRTTVNDPRFEVVDEVLKLRDGVSLDHEAESSVAVVLTAVDQSDSSIQIERTVTIQVDDANDQPKAILLSRYELASAIAGAEVGRLSVDDADLEAYTFTASDPRFMVEGSLLRLRDDAVIDALDERSVAVNITATAGSGETIEQSFTLEVADYPPYHNPDNPEDVNGDGEITPLDVLLLINRINAGGGGPLPDPSAGNGEGPIDTFPDVNGDNQLTAVDVLLIVNYLNSLRGEGEYVSPTATAPTSGPVPLTGSPVVGPFLPISRHDLEIEDEDDYQRRIQAELEEIVESLSRRQ